MLNFNLNPHIGTLLSGDTKLTRPTALIYAHALFEEVNDTRNSLIAEPDQSIKLSALDERAAELERRLNNAAVELVLHKMLREIISVTIKAGWGNQTAGEVVDIQQRRFPMAGLRVNVPLTVKLFQQNPNPNLSITELVNDNPTGSELSDLNQYTEALRELHHRVK